LAGGLCVVLDDCNERNVLKKSCGNNDKSFTKEVAKVDDIKRGHSTWALSIGDFAHYASKKAFPFSLDAI
jgi:hypothetical protein